MRSSCSVCLLFIWEPEELQTTCEGLKQSLKNYEEQITVPNLSQPAPYEHLNGLENKGYLPPKRATITSPTMSIFGTKLAFTYNPPTHRLALRPQGIVSTGPLPLISWSIKKRVPYPPQMTLCFLRCTLTQSPVFTMSTESVKVCLLPSAFTYCKRHLIRQNAAVYTITSNLLPLALHQNL